MFRVEFSYQPTKDAADDVDHHREVRRRVMEALDEYSGEVGSISATSYARISPPSHVEAVQYRLYFRFMESVRHFYNFLWRLPNEVPIVFGVIKYEDAKALGEIENPWPPTIQ